MLNNDDYDYDSLVGDGFRDIDYLAEEHTNKAMSSLMAITGRGLETSFGAKIATVYGRKGFTTHDAVTGPRNPGYASEQDDIILQVTIRVNGRSVAEKKSGFESLSELIDQVRDEHREAETKRIEKELAHAEEAAARLNHIVQEKRKKLSELKDPS